MGKKAKRHDMANDDMAHLPKMKRKHFEEELYKLQVELARLQAWAVANGARIIVVFEGRDTAGKGGVISRITQRVSPRVFKHVALRPREIADVHAALLRALPVGRGNHSLRPLLVQPCRR